MARWHISESGRPNPCDAPEGHCPLGGEHYRTSGEARAAYSASNINTALRSTSASTVKQPTVHGPHITPGDRADIERIVSATGPRFEAPDVDLPNCYEPYLSPGDKVRYACEAAKIVEAKGLTPVSFSIVGSALRGNDRPDSDVDVLVIVDGKTRSKVFYGGGFDGKIESMDNYLKKYGRSVPYVEFLLSPFRVTDRRFKPMMDSLRWETTEFMWHADKFVQHAKNRDPAKGQQMATGVETMIREGRIATPRDRFTAPPT